MKKAFTLIEMLIVIGIISVLVGVSLTSFGKMMKSAEKAKAQELVSNAATALTALYEADGVWPKKIREANASKEQGKLNAEIALILSKRGYLPLSMANGKLSGRDRFGVITPWAAKVVDRNGSSAKLSDAVTANTTVEDHILGFAVDLDGDGKILSQECGGRIGNVRATAVVWCLSKDGKDSVQSWTKGQEQAVK